MILHPLAAVETCRPCLLDHGFKVAIVVVAQHAREVAAGPEFVACRVGAADLFKRSDLVAHGTRTESRVWPSASCRWAGHVAAITHSATGGKVQMRNQNLGSLLMFEHPFYRNRGGIVTRTEMRHRKLKGTKVW